MEYRTTPAQRWALGLSSVASFVIVLDMLVVATALSTIQRDLHASLSDLEWTLNAYILSFAVLLMTGAAAGDRYGRRRVFAAGLFLFAAASAGCALAPSVGLLITARAVQGVGAAAIMPMSLAMLNSAFPPARRGWATGVYGSLTALAATVGPLVGGAVTQGIAWPWVFWINVPIGLAAVPLVLTRTSESATRPVPLDLPGLVLGALGALGLVWALVRGNTAGWTSPETLGAAGVGIAGVVAFGVRQRTAHAPMLPSRLFRSRAFTAGNGAIFFLNATLTGGIFFTAQYLQVAQGHGAFAAGLRLLPWGLAPLLIAPRAGALADRIGDRALAVAGTLAEAAGMAWLALVATPGAGYLSLVVPMALGGSGFALAVPAVTRSVVSLVAPADLGRASGSYATVRQLGGAVGVAGLGAVFAAAGGYASPHDFSAGYRAALALSVGLALAGMAAGLALPGRRPRVIPAVAAGPADPLDEPALPAR